MSKTASFQLKAILVKHAPTLMAVWETMRSHLEGMTLTTLEPIT